MPEDSRRHDVAFFRYQPVAQGLASHICCGASPVPNPEAQNLKGTNPARPAHRADPCYDSRFAQRNLRA